jgi:hypothetical protein
MQLLTAQLVILEQPVMLAIMELELTLEMQELMVLQAIQVQQVQGLQMVTQALLVQLAT